MPLAFHQNEDLVFRAHFYSDCSVILLDKYLILFGGLQTFPGDSTGSLIYCLNIAQKEWTQVGLNPDFIR